MKKGIKSIAAVIVTVSAMFGLSGCHNYYDSTWSKTYSDGDKVFSAGDSNNGRDKESELIDKLTAVTPNERQAEYLELEYYNFVHYGLNTQAGIVGWGSGKVSPSCFNPEKVDTDQWCEVFRASGSKGVILTAKHHDGFCLWQTKTTDYSVASSPYQNGKGDVVKQLAQSCKKYGLKLGIYLSPWDRHEPSYGTDAYNDFFKAQLTELLGGDYGEIFSVWFDGANGEDSETNRNFKYDWEGIKNLVHRLQPNAVTCIMGDDVRWVGNEAGKARLSEWSVVAEGKRNPDKVADLSQKDPAMAKKLQKADRNEDLGSRDLLSLYDDYAFYPAEVDVSIHDHFWYSEKEKPKSLQHLLQIYYQSVGANSSLLLNVPPSPNGIIEERDVKRLSEFGDALRAHRANSVKYQAYVGNGSNISEAAENRDATVAMSTENRDTSYAMNSQETVIDLKLNGKHKITRIDVREDLKYSQRIEYFDVYVKKGDRWELVSASTNVGNRRTIMLNPAKATQTDCVRIVIRQSRSNPVIRSILLYEE